MTSQQGLSPQVLYSTTGTTYTLGRSLGRGGMGQVYLAQRRSNTNGTSTGQLVALKILRPQAPEPARRLFYHEGTLLPRLQHNHIVPCVERGRGAIAGVGGVDFMALYYVAGETVDELLQRQHQPLPPSIVLGLAAQIADGLGYLHRRGVVHCDLKPTNIMLESATARAVLIDFGIARAPDFVGQPIAVGTPQYMAPEQINLDAPCDGRTDIYAFGIVLYELLTGRPLFPHRTTTDIKNNSLVSLDPRQLSGMLSADLAAVIAHCVRRDPAERFAHVEMLFEALRSALARQSDPISPQAREEGEW